MIVSSIDVGREDEATGGSSRDVDDERPQSSGGPATTAPVGQQPSPTQTHPLPLRLLPRLAAQRRATQLTGMVVGSPLSRVVVVVVVVVVDIDAQAACDAIVATPGEW